jgi:CBS domain-containing protein
MLVKDLMEPVTDNWLSPELSLHEAVCKMEATRWFGGGTTNGMLVLEREFKLVGVLSIKDIIRTAIPSYLETNLRGFAWDGMLEEHVRKACPIKVAEVMSRNLITIRPDDSLMRCADLFIDHSLQRLPVVDAAGRVLGMIHILNLYKHIASLMCTVEK